MARVATTQHLQDFHVHQVLSPYDSAHAKLNVQTVDSCEATCESAVFAGQRESTFTHRPAALGIRKLSQMDPQK